jgi:hypothetical protein
MYIKITVRHLVHDVHRDPCARRERRVNLGLTSHQADAMAQEPGFLNPPAQLQPLLRDFTRAVLQKQPENLVLFAKEFAFP